MHNIYKTKQEKNSMQAERLEILLEFLKKEPSDPFNRYAVAMELMNTDREKALEHFEIVRNEHPDYLPLYYQLGAIYFENEDIQKAELTYQTGINLAEKMNNEKTLKELKGAYQQLKDETSEW